MTATAVLRPILECDVVWVAACAALVIAVTCGIVAIVMTRPNGAACTSDPAMMPDTTGIYVSGLPRTLQIEDLPAPGPVIALGDAMVLRHSEEMRHEVSVLGADYVTPTWDLRPGSGRRLVSVLIRERNIGQLAIIPQAGDRTWLCDADGTWYQHDAAMTASVAGDGADLLDPRGQVDQKVMFQIRAGARPSRVRIVQHGYEWTETGDWKLG